MNHTPSITESKHLSLINEFAKELLRQDTPEDVLWCIAHQVIENLGFEDCVIYLFNEDRTKLLQKAAFGPKNPEGKIIKDEIIIPLGQGIVGTVAQTGVPENITDTRLDHRYIIDDEERLSELAVPILLKDEIIGVIDSEHHAVGFYTVEDQRVLEAIASMSADRIHLSIQKAKLKVEKQKLEETVRERTKELSETVESLRRSNALLEQYAHVVSHDLRQPLRTISSFVDLFMMKEQDLSAGGKEYMSVIKSASKRMHSMLEGMLSYAKLGSQPVDLISTDLSEVIQMAIANVDYLARDQDATIDVGELHQVMGSKTLLVQMAQNLIDNAIKYSREDLPPKIAIWSEIDGDLVSLYVQDNGIGIAPDHQQSIFDMFTQVDQKAHRGFGIGLGLVSQIVAAHHGEIMVHSEGLGRGSLFEITLPAGEPTQSD